MYQPHVFAFYLLQLQVSVQPQPKAKLTGWLCIWVYRRFSHMTKDTTSQAITRCSDGATGIGRRSGEEMRGMTNWICGSLQVPCDGRSRQSRNAQAELQGKNTTFVCLGYKPQTLVMPDRNLTPTRIFSTQCFQTTHMGNHTFNFFFSMSSHSEWGL